jgi:hypothetical protein
VNLTKGVPFPSPAWQLAQLLATKIGPSPSAALNTSPNAISPLKILCFAQNLSLEWVRQAIHFRVVKRALFYCIAKKTTSRHKIVII